MPVTTNVTWSLSVGFMVVMSRTAMESKRDFRTLMLDICNYAEIGLRTVPYYGYGRIFIKFPVTRTVKQGYSGNGIPDVVPVS